MGFDGPSGAQGTVGDVVSNLLPKIPLMFDSLKLYSVYVATYVSLID